MTQNNNRASLVTMPTELLGFIIPDPRVLHPQIRDLEYYELFWVPVNFQHTKEAKISSETIGTLLLLRALSQTSQRLRHFTLPLLWSAVEIRSIESLGKLREALKLMPHVASSIRHFSFCWDLPSDDIRHYPNNQPFKAFGRSGPDRHGEDPRIKSIADFNDCFNEIIPRLVNLDSFEWECESTPMPLDVVKVLAKAGQLRQLHTPTADSSTFKQVPVWDLAGKLEALSMRLPDGHTDDHDYRDDYLSTNSITAEDLIAFDVPSHPSLSPGEIDIPTATIWRTIVTAARGERLRGLTVSFNSVDVFWRPFAVQELLPAWIGINTWMRTAEWDQMYSSELADWDTLDWSDTRSSLWVVAAHMLRRALFHMSRLPAAQRDVLLDATNPALLTLVDVQAMLNHFTVSGLPRLSDPDDKEVMTELPASHLVQGSPIDHYFHWLLEDAELAQQVADALNAVVSRGSADLLKCYCRKCYTPKDREETTASAEA